METIWWRTISVSCLSEDRTRWITGVTAEVKLALMYAPEVSYTGVEPGATFTLREGPEIVGYGLVLSRGRESMSLPFRPDGESSRSQ